MYPLKMYFFFTPHVKELWNSLLQETCTGSSIRARKSHGLTDYICIFLH